MGLEDICIFSPIICRIEMTFARRPSRELGRFCQCRGRSAGVRWLGAGASLAAGAGLPATGRQVPPTPTGRRGSLATGQRGAGQRATDAPEGGPRTGRQGGGRARGGVRGPASAPPRPPLVDAQDAWPGEGRHQAGPGALGGTNGFQRRHFGSSSLYGELRRFDRSW